MRSKELQRIVAVFASFFVFAFTGVAQDIQFRNEIKGFHFYGRDKLKEIRLAFSKLDDWTRILGDECMATCDLNENWTVSFSSVGKDSISSITENNIEKKFMLFPKYEDTLWEIEIAPKKRVSFSGVRFPRTFHKGGGSSGGSDYLFDVYSDDGGLSYWIYAESAKDGRFKKGDLSSIKYTIPETVESKFHFLIEQKNIINKH